MSEVDQMIAAELRSWAVKGLWRKFGLEDTASYLRLCAAWGVSVELPAAPDRKCRACGEKISQQKRANAIYCSRACRERLNQRRARSRGAGQASPDLP